MRVCAKERAREQTSKQAQVGFYYAFRVFIIFPSFNQLHCRTTHTIRNNKYGFANATFLHLVAFERQNDKWILQFFLLLLRAWLRKIGTHQTNRENGKLFSERREKKYKYEQKIHSGIKSKKRSHIIPAFFSARATSKRPTIVADAYNLRCRQFIFALANKILHIEKHKKWKCCYWLYAKISIHQGNILIHGTIFLTPLLHHNIPFHLGWQQQLLLWRRRRRRWDSRNRIGTV